MPYRSSSLVALACVAVPLMARADVMLRFDSARGSCELIDRGGIPAVKCDASGNPSVSLGAKVVREVVGNFVEFRFPDAGEITVTPEADGQRISWKARTAQAAGPANKIAATPPAAAISAASTPSSGASVDEHGVLSVSGPNAGTAGPAATDEASALTGALQALLPEMQKDVQEQYDYSIPESPGFTIIGMTPEDVVHPRTLRDFAVALKDGVDESGRFKTGIALDFTPFQWFVRDQTLAEYLRVDTGDLDLDQLQLAAKQVPRRRYFNSNMLANTSVSIGTTQGTGDGDDSINLGLGLHVPIIDHSDGRERANECFGKTLFAKLKIAPGGAIPNPLNADEVNKLTSECLTPRWNDTVWTASLGYATTSEDGSFGDTKSGAYGIWSSFAYGFDGSSIAALRNNAQLILHAKVINKQTVQDPDDESLLIEQDSESIGAAFKFGSGRLNAALQASYSRLEDRTHDTRDDIQKLSVGLEYRLAPDLWLVATIGGEGGRDNGKNNSFVLGSLKYGTAAKPTRDPRPK
ncbi:MAG TPA: hypothetical protein VFZ95_10360 [Steroidobacteraceae bacterium]